MRFALKLSVVVVLVVFVAVGCVSSHGRIPVAPPAVLSSVSAPVSEYTTTGGTDYVSIYVLERTSGFLAPVSVPRKADDPPPVEYAVSLLNGGFSSSNYRLFGAPQSRIQRVTLENNVLTVTFSPAFQTWVTRNLAEERGFVQSVVLTFTSFQDVAAVRFMTNGHPMHGTVGHFQLDRPVPRPQVVNATVSSGASAVLYLRLRNANVLVPLSRPVEKREPDTALSELIRFRGTDSLVSPLPANVAVKSVRVENGVATVNLDKNVVTLMLQGAFDEQVVLDAVVHTLLEFPEVKQVQFLVDGRVLGPLGSNVDLSRPLSRTPINKLVSP